MLSARALEVAREADSLEDVAAALSVLRRLGLDDFGTVMFSLPDPRLPNLSRMLPRMADPAVQDQWTGCHGLTLLGQTTPFVRSVAYQYLKLTGQSLDGAKVLDFGCGYGRMARMLYYFTEAYTGVDPWDEALRLCRADGLMGAFELSAYLPETLPAASDFDLAIAFSVFTHTSEPATHAALRALRKHVRPGGLLAITIRPVEYWDFDTRYAADRQALLREHDRDGFAYRPHHGMETYGDTSMTVDYIRQTHPEWRVLGEDRVIVDSFQSYLFLS